MKAILEIQMPTRCSDCPLNTLMHYVESEDTWNLCVPLDTEIEYGLGNKRREDCPLKPIK